MIFGSPFLTVGKKDALRHINVHSYLIDKNPELFVIENKIKQWLKSKHGELFFLQTKGEIEKLHPSISDGRELSPLKERAAKLS